MGEKEGEKKGDASNTIVLKIDMHCEGCVKKITKSVKKFEGVETVHGDSGTNKLTVIGKVAPGTLREWLEHKTKKKVEIVTPQPAKKEPAKEGSGGGGGGGEDKKKAEEKKAGGGGGGGEDKKPKEAPVPTVVLKIRLHCDGCTTRIRKIISKYKGVHAVDIDTQKDLVTVKGTMDVKALQPYLKEKLKRGVDIVPPKKEGGDKKEGGGGEKAKGGDGGGEKKGGGDGGAKVEASKMDYFGYGSGFGYGGFEYGHHNVHPIVNPNAPPPPQYGQYVHAPQIFSDENPNACSIM